MKETITQYKFNSFEIELIGYLTSIINNISQDEFNLCPIYNSLVNLSIKKNNNINREEKSNGKYSLTDPYGFFSQNDSRKIITIVINTGKINEELIGVKSKRMKTIVLIHEIGHYIAYNIPLFSKIKIMPSNLKEFRRDKEFQELWAQAFTYKLFQSFYAGYRGFYSDKSCKNAYKCMEEMSKLADNQPPKYRTFKTLFGEDENSFNGDSYRNVDFEKIFYQLSKTRNENLLRGEYSEFFKNKF